MKLLSRLLKGTSAIPPMPEWHPLDELDDDPAPRSLADDFGWHVLSECADESACPIHGRNAEPAQCTAPTKTGRPCSKPPRPGSDRCTLPAHQRETP